MAITKEEIFELFRETDRRFQETSRKMQETDRQIKQLTQSIGQLGNRLGQFVEEMVKPDDVREHLDRLARFKKLFPTFHNHRAMGAMAAMVVSDETARYACRQGLFVLGQSGEAITLRNGEAFEPKIW